MDLISVLTIIAPTTLITAILTFFISKRKETRADADQVVSLFQQDNERLRAKELELETKVELQSKRISELEVRINELYNKLILLESAHNESPLPMWLKDSNGVMLALNNAYYETFLKPLGKTVKSYIGNTDFDVWPEEVAKQFRENDLRVREEGVIDTIEEVPDANNNLIKWRIIKYSRFLGNIFIGVAGIAVPIEKTNILKKLKPMKNPFQN